MRGSSTRTCRSSREPPRESDQGDRDKSLALAKKAASAAFLLDDGWLLGQAKACEVIPDFSTSTNASIFAERVPVRHAITVQTFR
jgi:hypothetical protein